MRMRPKTIRRLMILFGGLCIVAAVIAWAVLLDSRHLAARMKTMRAQAMTSYNAGHYETAVKELGQYLDVANSGYRSGSVVRLRQIAHQVEMPRLEHVYEGIQIFQQYFQLAQAAASRKLPKHKSFSSACMFRRNTTRKPSSWPTTSSSHKPEDIEALPGQDQSASEPGELFGCAATPADLFNAG